MLPESPRDAPELPRRLCYEFAVDIVSMFRDKLLDFVLKLYLPKGGTIFIYALTILLLLWRPQGLFGRKAT